MLSRTQTLAIVVCVLLGLIGLLVLGNYYVSLAAVVSVLVIGLVALVRNRSASHRRPQQ